MGRNRLETVQPASTIVSATIDDIAIQTTLTKLKASVPKSRSFRFHATTDCILRLESVLSRTSIFRPGLMSEALVHSLPKSMAMKDALEVNERRARTSATSAVLGAIREREV